MRSIFNYIISPLKDRYNNTELIGNTEFVVNTDISNFKHISREAVVKSTPLEIDSPIEVGDMVIIHHNVFRRWYDVRGIEKNSSSFINEYDYACEHSQIYMYKKQGETKWRSLDDSCLVSPIPNTNKYFNSSEERLMGIVEYSNEKLTDSGVIKGDVVGFTPSSEWEFIIDGKKMYKMSYRDVCIKYN